MTGHQADRRGERCRTRYRLHQRGDHIEVQRTGIHLADVVEDPGEAEVLGDAVLELIDEFGLTVEEVELILLGADRPLQTAERIAIQQVRHPVEGEQRLLAGVGEPLAERGHLRGHVVRARRQWLGAVLPRQIGQSDQRRDHPVTDQHQAVADLHLLDVLGQVPRGHALVDLLVTGQGAELVDPGLDVVQGLTLALGDRCQVDPVDDGFVCLDRAVGHVDAEISLGAQHGDPQPALRDHLVPRRPDGRHLGAGVPISQDVGDVAHRRILSPDGGPTFSPLLLPGRLSPLLVPGRLSPPSPRDARRGRRRAPDR